MNQTYKIRIRSPLLRPGIEIETDVSTKYLVASLRDIMEKVREFNAEADSGLGNKTER